MTSVDEQIAALAAQVRSAGRAVPRGAGTKIRSGDTAGAEVIECGNLSGILEYEPTEYTFTALAGTPVREVAEALTKNGQYLPFDPLLAEKGATLGGTVACSMNGPGRLRYGGVRDFVIGIRFIDAEGRLIRGGGKVVKNAAGFDFPKFFCGSFGRLGVITELSFKVFPAPAARTTLKIQCGSVEDALERLAFIAGQPWEVEALEIVPERSGSAQLLARFMGDEPALTNRCRQISAAVGRSVTAENPDIWRTLRSFPDAGAAIRVPLTASRIPELHAALTNAGAAHAVTYSEAANAAWIRWPEDLPVSAIDSMLAKLGLPGIVLGGSARSLRIGLAGQTGAERLAKQALDPHGKFLPF